MKASSRLSSLCCACKLPMVLMLPLLAVLYGCGGSGTSVSAPPADKPAVSITASPASLTAGTSSTLSVTATNATQVTLTGSDGSSYTMSATGGKQSVTPSATTTYTVNATGTGGSVSSSATITVSAAPVAPTVTIGANPTSITAGGSSTLTVAATNATQVDVTGTDGSSYTLAAAGGTQTVSPAATTTYTVNVSGAGGKASATATVTVTAPVPLPTVTIMANPATINAGGSSTLTVTAAGAAQLAVTGSDGSNYTLAATGGTEAVSPAATTTYTVNATNAGGTATATAVVTVNPLPAVTVTIAASPTSVNLGGSSTLTVVAANATGVVVTGSDNSTYTLAATGGTQSVTPNATTTYTATATGAGGTTTATATVAVGSVQSINHVIFMLQENHSFDAYFGMLNPYREAQGWNVGDDGKTYTVDGIDDKLEKISNVNNEGTSFSLYKFASTCIDDDSSAWESSYGDVNRYDFTTARPIRMDGFVHTAEGFATSCANSGKCSGSFTDTAGQRAMGYYDEGFLNYYYYMASQFAVSDRWFSPVASKSIDNRIATFTGGTTQGLVQDPGGDDKLSQLAIKTIFNELQAANVSWKIYYTVTEGFCETEDECQGQSAYAKFPATDFGSLSYSFNFLRENPTGTCPGTLQPSSVVGDASNSFCVDPTHIAPLAQYYTDLTNGTLPSFAFIEAGYANNDEHPGSGQSILAGQAQVSKVVNAFMNSPSWNDSVFFFGYDEGGGPYDHVPPVPGHSNDFTDKSLGTIPDIGSVSVSPDSYIPCVPTAAAPGDPVVPTTHCDLDSTWPGAHADDAAAVNGFGAQIGFRIPNFVVSPFTRRHYVSHIPMDHTAIIKFVENRFLGPNVSLTARDAAQPNLLDFFDFAGEPWATPPNPPSPVTASTLGYNPCTPASLGP